MGGSGALVTIRDNITYINDVNMAKYHLDRLASSAGASGEADGDVVEGSLVKTFVKKVRAVAGEVGSQVAVSAATGVACESGSKAYRVARSHAPQLANGIRKEVRASGAARHDLSDVVQPLGTQFDMISEEKASMIRALACNDVIQDVADPSNEFYMGHPMKSIGTQTLHEIKDRIADYDAKLEGLMANVEIVAQSGATEFGSQADAHTIQKDVFHAQHMSAHEEDFQKLVRSHKERHLGGTLPNELRSFQAFVRYRTKFLEVEDKPKYLLCGALREF